MPSSITYKDQLDCAWKHFAFIADQRIRTFNFYVILLAASIGGTITVFEKLPHFKPYFMCGAWHIVIASIFFVIDVRSRRLLEIPKEALAWFESQETWASPKLITVDRARMTGFNKGLSFTAAFRCTFLAHAALGVIVISYACFRF